MGKEGVRSRLQLFWQMIPSQTGLFQVQIFPSTTEHIASHALARVQRRIGAPGAVTHALGLMRSVVC